MFQLIKNTPKFDFIGYWPLAVTFSLVLCLASLFVFVQKGESKYGIDYVGGHELLVKITEKVDSDNVRKVLEDAGFAGAIVQSFEAGSSDYSVRFPSSEETKVIREKVQAAFKARFGDKFEIVKTDFVGPTLGVELREKALLAVILGLLAIAIYVTVRFEAAFAIGALVSLLHDVVVATGVYLFAGHELNGAALAAALTVVGYSVNDTIVIFDKVREELYRTRDDKIDLAQLLNAANNAMLGRTIITTVLTFLSTLALYLFGGGSIQDLSLYLLVGIASGVYSTIFIACPCVLAWDNFRQRRRKGKLAAQAA